MGNLIENWHFDFGLVIPGSKNDWEQTIEAAEKQDMIPAEVLSGNMMIETQFFSEDTMIYRSKMTVIYN